MSDLCHVQFIYKSNNVLIRMPLKMLPVELEVALFINISPMKYMYKNSDVTTSLLHRMENTDSLISQSVGVSWIK